jgi:hypothetical protein
MASLRHIIDLLRDAGLTGENDVFDSDKEITGTLTLGGALINAVGLTGGNVATVANVPTTPGVPVVFPITVPSGANGDVDIVVAQKVTVFGMHGYMKGAGTAGCLITVKNGASAISNAIDVSAFLDKALITPGTWDDAQHTISAAGTLRVSKASTGANFPGAELYILAMRVA